MRPMPSGSDRSWLWLTSSCKSEVSLGRVGGSATKELCSTDSRSSQMRSPTEFGNLLKLLWSKRRVCSELKVPTTPGSSLSRFSPKSASRSESERPTNSHGSVATKFCRTCNSTKFFRFEISGENSSIRLLSTFRTVRLDARVTSVVTALSLR